MELTRISGRGVSIIFGTLGQDMELVAIAFFALDPFDGFLVKAEKFLQAPRQLLLSFFQEMIWGLSKEQEDHYK